MSESPDTEYTDEKFARAVWDYLRERGTEARFESDDLGVLDADGVILDIYGWLAKGWLAAHDAEVAAKALDDAAGDWSALVMEGKPPMTGAS